MKDSGKNKRHILHYASLIEAEGIVVIDNITTMPVFNEPFISEYMVFGVCNSGSNYAKYGINSGDLVQKDMYIIFPNHIIMADRVSEDYNTTLVVVSKGMFEEISSHFSFQRRFQYEQNPIYHLSDSQYEDILKIIAAMRVLGRSGMPSRKYHLIAMFVALIKLSDFFRCLSSSEEDSVVSRHRISAQFFDAIVKHYQQEHSVAFYAELLCLSPKYFSDVIKQETGHGAKYWIESYIIIEAKRLLRTQKNLNMQEISALLGYDDQTTFSRSFKKVAGETPSSFRQRHK